MTILDRYTLRLFFKIYTISMVCLLGLYFVIDMVTNLDKLSRSVGQTESLIDTMIQYYGARAFLFFNATNAVMVLIATTCTIASMRSNNELIALQSIGTSPLRAAKPVVLAAVLIATLAATNREWIIPYFQKDLARTAQNWQGTEKETIRATFDHKTDIMIGGQHAFSGRQEIVNPRFHLHRPLGEFPRVIEAGSAFYQPANENHPAGYLLKKVLKPADCHQRPAAHLDGSIVILTAADPATAEWLETTDLFVVSNLPFELLVAENSQFRYSSTGQLMGLLQNNSLDYGAHIRVQLHARIVQPVLDLTLLFLGLPLVLSRNAKSMVRAVFMGSLVVILFFSIVLTCHTLGSSGYVISPSLAAWLPLIILIPLAYFNSASIW